MTQDGHVPINRRFAKPSDEQLRIQEYQNWLDHQYDAYTMGWSEILPGMRTVVLGEAKSGKTHEFKKQKEVLLSQGEFAFFLPLEQLHDHEIKDVLSAQEETLLSDWLQQDRTNAWFFLDAVDELKLRTGSFEVALRKLQKLIGRKSASAHIFVSCRPADWNVHIDVAALERHFSLQSSQEQKVVTPPPDVSSDSSMDCGIIYQTVMADTGDENKIIVLQLLPLTPDQTIEFANCWNPNKAHGLREAIDKQDIWHLFQTPDDIINGLTHIEKAGDLGSLQDQISSGIDRKLRDHANNLRTQQLSLKKARIGAERLALALSLTKHRSLTLTSHNSNHLDAATILTDWKQQEQKELLTRGIFSLSGIDAVGFHHRSTQEFLAAKRLKNLISDGLPINEAIQLLFCEQFGEKVVIPSLEPVAAWLALWNEDILAEVKIRKPEILFRQGLPASMTIETRKEMLRHYISSYQGDGWRLVSISHDDAKRIGHCDLSSVVKELWLDAYSGHDSRDLLLKLIWHTPLCSCTHLSLDAAFDTDLPTMHRAYACHSVLENGTDEQKQSLGQALLKSQWDDELVHSIIPNLYPCGLNLDEIIAVAVKTKEIPHLVPGLGYALYALVKNMKKSVENIRVLRSALTEKVWSERNNECSSIQTSSKYDHFTDAILAACAHDTVLVSSEEIENWAWSVVVALKFGEQSESIIASEDFKLINSRIQENVRLREACFWASLRLIDELETERDRWSRYWGAIDSIDIFRKLTVADIPWLYQALDNTSNQERRPVAFIRLLLIWKEVGDENIADGVRSRINDLPDLIEEYEMYLNPPPAEQSDNWSSNYEEEVKNQKEKERSRLNDWDAWCRDVRNAPNEMLSDDRRQNTLLNLYTWLNMNESKVVLMGNWDVEKVRLELSDEFLRLARPALSESWRQAKPKLWSERDANYRNNYPIDWLVALMSIKCEAENLDWAGKLTKQEAKLATRISMIELNGFAAYLPALEKTHPEAVYEIIVEELSSQLSLMSVTGEFPIAQDLKYHGAKKVNEAAASFLGANLDKWPHNMTPNIRHALRHCVGLILDFGSTECVSTATYSVQHHLKSSMADEDKAAWLSALAVLNPSIGCQKVLAETASLEDKFQLSRAILIFATVFGEQHYSERKLDFSQISIEERVDLLFKLVRRVYEIAHPSTDIRDDVTDTFSTRYDAEEARNYLFGQLATLDCLQSYHALHKLSKLDDFTNMKDRLRQMATEMAARQSEPEPMTAAVFEALDQKRVTKPMDNRSIHNVMLNRLNDYFHFVKESEFSNRKTLQRIEDETELRRNIANWLNDHRRDAYTINQEAVKKGEKRTDIRLTSSLVDIESVIELKLDDKNFRWSGSKLEQALTCQLAEQYLSHKRCCSGCLLICMREHRKWKNPHSGVLMNLTETVTWLQGIANEIMKANSELLVSVRGLDLTC